MIFVTVGMNNLGFNRLIMEMDRIAPGFNEEIIMQIGNTSFTPKNTKYFDYKKKNEMDTLYENARIVISHGGAGSIINILKRNKRAIIVPRQQKYGEIFDDQQIELARELSQDGSVVMVCDVSKLQNVLLKLSTEAITQKHVKREYLIDKLNEYILSSDC